MAGRSCAHKPITSSSVTDSMRILLIIGVCAGVTLILGAINIWLGVLSLPITYPLAMSLLRK